MPAEDPIVPEQNLWLEAIRQGKPKPRQATQAARVQTLALSLGLDAEQLAKTIPEDTLRRLKYPVVEQPQPDGTTAFKHDLGISEETRPFLGTDRAYGDIPKSTAARDSHGRFRTKGGET